MADRDPGAMAVPSSDSLLHRSRWPLNDLGNAQRFEVLAAGRLCFVGELGRSGDWLWFDGVRWTPRDAGARARAIALAVCDELTDEARVLMAASEAEYQAVFGPRFTEEMRKERVTQLYQWAMKTGNSDRTSGLLKQAQGLEDDKGRFLMRATLDEFDTDPLAYHCMNGTIRFEEGADGWAVRFEKGHRPGDRFMAVAAVAYDPHATAPDWEARMIELHDDAVARTAIQRIYGMTLTGLISDQAFYIFQGKGNDGKSMTNKIIGDLHGDYFKPASPKTFLQAKQERGGSEHQADIVRLKGDVRMVVADEPKKGSTWDGERIKQVTGSRIVARAPNALEDITYTPRWQLIVECNQIPNAPSDDRGFRRRFKLFPWMKTYGVTEGLTDELPHIVEKRLMGQASGILNWMIAGAIEWLTTGDIPEPEASRAATSSFWSAGSAMSEWLMDRCDISDPAASCGSTELYEDFKAFCAERGDDPDKVMNQTLFGKGLTEAQLYVSRDARGRKVRMGVRLKARGEGRADEPRAEGWRDADMKRFDDDPGPEWADGDDPYV